MDCNPFPSGSNFVDLLQSQQESVFSASQVPYYVNQSTEDCNLGKETPVERRERRKWTPSDDILLISSWFNTSKDPVVANEQRSGAFWKRIAAYFAASQKVSGCEQREPMHCKQRWQKINDLVCKFCGSYEAATREKTSGQNDADLLKKAHEIFYNNHKKKFTLEYAWLELRNDQKWSDLSSSKQSSSSKKRKLDDGAQSSTSHATESKMSACDEGLNRPPGVKASKARGKKTDEGKGLSEFQTMWSIRQKDLVMKERLSKMSLLGNLVANKDTLSESEEALKNKLIEELLYV
ncbi:glutathione S-transferase T3-like [Brassica napus]|uniref:glutathione S-transferase T3-like n=1 Tax=Brassica napus TaxID=3708 RepID=UPI0020799970|nr:glutathione S-transferase T3-like [Brassica napus]